MAQDRPVGYSRAVVSELHDVREFLAGRPPFVALPGAALDLLPRHIAVRYLRRGAIFPPTDADPSGLYVLRKGAVEIRDAAGSLWLTPGGYVDNTPSNLGKVRTKGIEINKTLAEEQAKSLLPAQQGRNHAASPAPAR